MALIDPYPFRMFPNQFPGNGRSPSRDPIRRIFALVIIIITAIIISQALASRGSPANNHKLALISLSITILSAVATVYFYFVTKSSYTRSLSISLLGPPAVGKTTYLTMLYSELGTERARQLQFLPYGTVTAERVIRNLQTMGRYHEMLAQGVFPPPTDPSSYEMYELVAVYEPGFRGTKYRIQIGDFSGTLFESFSISDKNWAHNPKYFDKIVSSDAIIFIIDVPRTLSASGFVSRFVADSIAVIHTLVETRGRESTAPLGIPVALILSKADGIDITQLDSEAIMPIVLHRLREMIEVCRARCEHFAIFLVSSLGISPDHQDLSPRHFAPIGVLEPLLWILGANSREVLQQMSEHGYVMPFIRTNVSRIDNESSQEQHKSGCQ